MRLALLLTTVLFLSVGETRADMDPMEGEEPVMSSSHYEDSPKTRRMAKQFEDDIKNGRLAKRTNQALNALIRLGAYKLTRMGFKKQAKDMVFEWEHQWDGEIIKLAGRGIGDHAPLSKWLASKYDMMESILTKSVCDALRLSDIKTINFAIPVVVSCIDNVSEDEYFAHFVNDYLNGYSGLGPVVVYWVSFFSCVGATWGTGFLYCSPIALGVEYLSENFVCPALNKTLWQTACNQGVTYSTMGR